MAVGGSAIAWGGQQQGARHATQHVVTASCSNIESFVPGPHLLIVRDGKGLGSKAVCLTWHLLGAVRKACSLRLGLGSNSSQRASHNTYRSSTCQLSSLQKPESQSHSPSGT